MLAPAALAAFAIFAAPPADAEASEADSVSCAPSTEVAADKSRIVVQVLDANTSARIPGAKIFITGDAGGREFLSDELGGRQVDGVPPGAYVVLADAEVGNDQVYVQASPGHQCVVSFRLGEVVGLEPEGPEAISTDDAIEAHRLRRERGNTMKGVGIGVVTLGGALLVGSAFSAAIGPCGQDGSTGADCSQDLRRNLAIGFGVSGGLTLAGGIAMIVVGAKRANGTMAASVLPTRHGAAFSLSGRF